MRAVMVRSLLIGLALMGVVGCKSWEESNSPPPAFDSHRFDANPWERER